MIKGASFNNEVVDSNARAVNAGGISEAQDDANALYSRINGASCELVPSAYKEGTVYAGTGINGDLTFTRAGDAWRINGQGLIQRVPWNLISYSEQFDSNWLSNNLSIATNSISAPNGTLRADKLMVTTTNGNHRVLQALSSQSANHTISIYAKKGELNFIQLAMGNNVEQYANFNLDTGVVGTKGTYCASSSITSVGDGWFRCTAYINQGTIPTLMIYLVNSASSSWGGVVSWSGANNTDGIYVWGAQLVEGTLPQTYFPTTDRLNVPRLDYTYGSSPSLLLEPQRTNSVIYSEQLDLWTGGFSATTTANTSISPDGTQNADNISITATNGYWRRLGLSTTASTSYTASVFVKKSSTTGTNNFRFYYNNNVIAPSGGEVRSVVNLTDLTITTTAVGTAGTGIPTIISSSLVPYGNGWYRVVVSFTTGTSAVSSNGEIGFLANGVIVNFDAWGAQFETGAYATSYIQTREASVTRLVDSFSRNNIYTNGLITSSGGTWFAEFKNNLAYTGDTGGDFISIGDTLSTVGNNFRLYNSPSYLGRMEIRKTIASASTLLYTTTTDNVKMIIKWNGSTADVFVNGVKVVSATAFTTTLMENFITNIVASPKFIQQMDLFPTPLSDSECIRLTADYTDGSSVIGNYERYVNNLGGTVENLNGVTNLIQNLR